MTAIRVQAYGKILTFPEGTSEDQIRETLSRDEPDLNPEYKPPEPEALDYAKGFAVGANKLVSGVGYLAEAAGADETGKAIRDFGDRGAAYWNAQMSPGGKRAAQSQVFVDDPESITGLRLGDDAGKALLMGAAQSLPSMFAAALPGVAITKGIQALASLGLAGGAGATIPLLAGTAAPVGMASQVIARAPAAIGFGAAEGVVSGGMNAAGLKTSIEGMSDKELLKSPVYQALRAQHGEDKARAMLADQAASDLFGKTAVSTGVIGALTGGGALGSAYQKTSTGAADGILMTGLKGGGQEAIQETPQSGGEKYIENVTRKEYVDPSVDPMSGVIAEAASGGAIGAFTGGIVGAGSAVNITKQADQQAQRINAEKINPIHEATTVDDAIVAANEAVKGKPVTKEDVLRTVDPTLADIEAATGLKPSEALKHAEENPDHVLQSSQAEAVPNNAGQPQAAEVLGHPTEIVLPDNSTVKAQWKIVDADKLAASMKEDVNQPRGRTRASSDVQIQSIANKPDFRRLSHSPVMDIGAPVIDQEGRIVAGNGRFEGLAKAYAQGTINDYLGQLRTKAIEFGINPATMQDMTKPVLVRQLSEPVDTRKLAIASNSGTTLQMSALEQAKLDAERMKGIENLDVNDLGDIALTPRNLTQLKDSLGTYVGTELGAMVDKGGQLSQEGMRRVRNAMLAKAYGASPVLEKLVESTDTDMRNVLGALTKSANHIIKTKGDVKSLMEAVDTYSQLKATGQPVDNFLAQQDAFSDGLSKEAEGILRFIETNVRSQKKLTDFFKGNFVETDTTSADMFAPKLSVAATNKVNLAEGSDIRETRIGDSTLVYGNSDGKLKLYSIRTPQAKRGAGSARQAMEAFVAQADKENKTVFLDASALDKKTSTDKLVTFYKSLGFELTGKKVNPLGEPEMKRSPNAKDSNVKQLEKHLKDNGYDFTVEPASVRDVDALDSTKKARKELAEKQAKLFKKKVVFVKADGPFKINGAMVPSIDDTIFVDIRTAKPFDAIMAHELSHWMEQEKPEVYKAMLKSLKTVIIDEAEYAKKYGIEGATKAEITKEIAGDLMGDNFTKESFWEKVAAANPEAFKDIAATIIKWLKGVIVKAKANGMGSEQWVKDATKAQDIIAKAVAQYTESNAAPVSAESKPKFNASPKTITVDDVERPTTNSEGKPINNPVNFWKWFGDSKVVDDQGRPLVVYHGTDKAFSKVNVKKGAQNVFWFSSDKESIIAGESGAVSTSKIMPLYVRIENPANWKQYDNLGLSEFSRDNLDGAILPRKNGQFEGFVFDGSQVKSIDNNGDFSTTDMRLKFSKAEVDRTLIAQHNLSVRKLIHADRMGALAVPSIAITDKAHPLTGFGEITLLADEDFVNNSRTFGADIYSTRYPEVSYDFSIKDINKLNDQFKDEKSRLGEHEFYSSNMDYPERILKESPAVAIKFLESEGIKPRIKLTTPSEKPGPGLMKWVKSPLDRQELARDPKFIEDVKKDYVVKFKDLPSDELEGVLPENDDQWRNVATRQAFKVTNYRESLKNKGKVDLDDTRSSLIDQIRLNKRMDKFNAYIDSVITEINPKQEIFDKLTNTGSGRKYIEHSLDNVIMKMRSSFVGGESFGFGLGRVRGVHAPEFKSIEQIRKNKHRLMNDKDFDVIKKEVDKELTDLVEKVNRYGTYSGFDNVNQAIFDSAKMGIPKALTYNGFKNVPADVKSEIENFIEKLRNMPTEYFEAKALRGVKLGEFKAAIVPKDISQEALDILKKNGIEDIRKYKSGDNEDRVKQINKVTHVMFSRAPKLYSKLEQALEAANDKVFSTGPQVKLWLQSNAGKLGIKKDEIYWSGIDNWLDAQGKISKQQVVEFVRNNGAKVEDVTLGESQAASDYKNYRQASLAAQIAANRAYREYVADPSTYDNFVRATATASRAAASVEESARAVDDSPQAKHNNDKLTLPGGTDYKELVVTVPTIEPHNADDSTHFGDTGQGKQIGWLRMDTRDGGLFIEELQSQRAQQGRSKGFDVVPPAPFVSDANNKATNAYITLLMKKALIEAVSNDQASVSWATGDQQSERYDLSKQISEVKYSSNYLKAYNLDGDLVLNEKNVPENKLQDYIGKDAAEKLIAQPKEGPGKMQHLSGVDLKVGGEWAQSMYGNRQGLNAQGKPSLMSQAANDIFKHVGSGKVESINGQPGFYVTPEMKSKDLPLFSRTKGWDDFPDAIIAHRSVSDRPQYQTAKDGDFNAAMQLADDTVTRKYVDDIKNAIGSNNPIVVPVRSAEGGGSANAIPEAVGMAISEKLNLPFDENDIHQIERVGRTEADGWHRIANLPTFEGDVVKGSTYLIVDDTLAQGGTVAQLKEYIETNGGKVALITALTGKQYSAKIGLSDFTLSTLRDKHGSIEPWFTKSFGYSFAGLTESEARFLISAKGLSSEQVRERITEAKLEGTNRDVQESTDELRNSRRQRILAKEIPEPKDGLKFSKDLNLVGARKENVRTPPAETRLRKFQRDFQDSFNRFTVIQDWLKKEGITLSEKADVRGAEERYHSKVANQIEDFYNNVRNPLIEKIAKAGYTMDDVEVFLKMQHAQEANAAIRKLNDKPDATANGISDQEAQDYLNEAPAKLAALSNEFRSITEQSKKLRLDNGLLNKDITDAYESAYKHYIPLKGEADTERGTGKGLSVNFKSKRRLGHALRDEHVIENILMDHERAIMEVEKNRVAKHLAMMAAEISMPELISIAQPEKRKVLRNTVAYQVLVKGVGNGVFSTLQEAQMFQKLLPSINKNVSQGDITIDKTTDQRIIASASPMLADNELNVYIDGHAIRLQINDQVAAESYKKLGDEGFSDLLDAGRTLNNYLSKVYTGYNPEFIITNIIRDFTSGTINLTGEQGLKMALKSISNYPRMFGDLFKYAITNGKSSTKWIDGYRANGGNTGAAYLSDMERLGKEVATEYASYQGVISNLKQGDTANAARAAGRKVFNMTLKWINNLNQAGENAMRVSAYKAMLESGKTVNEASKAAKNITVNFNRKGAKKWPSALYLFFNASVQGTAATAHALTKGEHKYQAQALAAGMAAVGYMVASSFGGGSEDDWDEISDYTKERNLLIKNGDGYIKIPIPYGYGFFYGLGRGMADAQRKGELGVLPWHIMTSAISEFTPFNDIVVGSDNEFKSDQVFTGLLPTAMKIAAQPIYNKQLFSGSELMPESSFDKSQPDREKMFRSTKGTVYDELAGALQSLPGVLSVDMSPETLKYLTRTFTGGAGSLVDTSVSASMLKAQGAELDTAEIPFVRKGYMELGIKDKRAAYYKVREEARTAAEEFNRARRAMDVGKMQDVLKDKKELIALDRYANKLSTTIDAARDQQDAVRADKKLSVQEKRLKLKDMEATESKFYDQYLDVFKATSK